MNNYSILLYLILCFILGALTEYKFGWWTWLENNVFYKIEKKIERK